MFVTFSVLGVLDPTASKGTETGNSVPCVINKFLLEECLCIVFTRCKYERVLR